MRRCHHVVSSRTVLQTRQRAEDATRAVVEEKDAQTAVEVSVPQRVLVIKETEVSDYADRQSRRGKRESSRRGQRTFEVLADGGGEIFRGTARRP